MSRVALITPIFPYPPTSGSRIRTFHIARYLGRRREVAVLSLEGGDVGKASSALGLRIETLDLPGLNGRTERVGPFTFPTQPIEAVSDFVERMDAHVVHGVKSFVGAVLQLPVRPQRTPVVLDEACVHHISYRREAGWADTPWHRARAAIRWLRLRRYEARLARAVDAVLAVSVAEARVVRRFAPEIRVIVVPNGVDCEAIRPMALGDAVMFCGALTYGPNRDAAVFFLHRILPRLRAGGCRASVLFVGAGADEELRALAAGDGRVELPGMVDDLAPWYARAAVVINPMRGGGGTRMKVLEALAFGRPVVTTAVGVEGLDVADGREVEVRDAPSAFAAAIARLLADPEAASAMGRAGRALVEQRYDWRACLAPLDGLYDEILTEGKTRA